MCKKRGQSLAEYAIVVSLIAVVLAAMGPGFRRSVQQIIKSIADIVGFQSGAEQASDPDDGFLNMQRSNVQSFVNGSSYEAGGKYFSAETQETNTQSISYTNGAFIRD